ncbi:MAG: zinc metallopeptidase [Myxococcota bacterium]|nr:zinc metallopeptidase [Myxococcota bacterium]MDW8362447.1 zinc metallopeptidase [Myxococcales bacterium]
MLDPLYFAMLAPAMLLSLWATFATKRRFAQFAEVPNARGMTGADAARAILDRAGLHHVRVEPHDGWLTDHYDPRDRTVRLSPDVYHGRSISALAVAAHETGHALQHAKRYWPLEVRTLAVPVASLGSNLGFILIAVGMLLSMAGLSLLGVILFSATVLFQLITLPVEFDASERAKKLLFDHGIIVPSEQAGVAKVLSAAAMTYVAAAITSVLTLLYFLIRLGVLGGRREE